MRPSRIGSLTMAVVLVLAGRVAGQTSPAAGPAGWRTDLRYLVGTIKAVHPRPFHRVPEARFDSAVRALERRLPRLSDQQAVLGMMRLVAMVHDAHTVLEPAGRVFTRKRWYPVRIDRLGDGFFVVATTPAHRELLGARVGSLGGRPIGAVWDSVAALAPGDNEYSRLARTPYWLMMPELMTALGLSAGDRLSLGVVVDGRERTVTLDAVPGDHSVWLVYRDRVAGDSTATLPLAGGDQVDLPYRHPDLPYWFTVDRTSRLLYARINLVSNADRAVVLDRDTARIGLRDFGDRVLARIDSGDVGTLVLDLRDNPGGNNGLIQPFVHGLEARSGINRRGQLFVITGRRTYSAAMNFVSLLEERTAAVFVGEPPGGAPSHYGDATGFTLPVSGLTVTVSTLHWDLGVAPTDVREVDEPELPAAPTMASRREGRDPAMEAIRGWAPGDLIRDRLLSQYRAGGLDDALAVARAEAAATGPGLRPSRVQALVGFRYGLYGAGATAADVRKAFAAIAAIYPESAYAWFHLGRVHLQTGQPREAAQAFERAARLRPANDLIRRFRAVAERQAGSVRR